jgi:O-acetylhomoserine/O-acetylserine sulfhydrylase-like pyridoxal-dependent enzyme
MFLDVYYIKGAFLDSEKAFDVLNGMKNLEQRIMAKAINTLVFSEFLASHADFNVNCHALPDHPNASIREKQLRHGWPCALFTVDVQRAGINRETFTRFFDALEPALSHQISIGQNNTIILCPALTSHSEMGESEQKDAGIYLTTMRIAVGTDNIKEIIAHFINSCRLHIDEAIPSFSDKFMPLEQIDELYLKTATRVTEQHYSSVAQMSDII